MPEFKEHYEEELTAVLSAMLGCKPDEILDLFKSMDSDIIELSAQALTENASASGGYEVSLENLKKEIKNYEEWRVVFDTEGYIGSDETEEDER
ncbi:hypothetical protein [Eubacterium sp. 1001713B170207_170306_E7]|uniref:hypothetical protein n=1 Tax=Eubacterium sp. 1001713B170207_170306_E7 TaxID=2787097 RepID=UPI001897E014|nr:hypothetical protein [Eubacterium sp. 1001713B170207_170306_E7]